MQMVMNLWHNTPHQGQLYISRRRRKKLVRAKRQKELSLLDCEEYIANPVAYFMCKEHWSLDGG